MKGALYTRIFPLDFRGSVLYYDDVPEVAAQWQIQW